MQAMSEEQTLVAALRTKLQDEELQEKLMGAANLNDALLSVGRVGVVHLMDAARDLCKEDRLLGNKALMALEHAMSFIDFDDIHDYHSR